MTAPEVDVYGLPAADPRSPYLAQDEDSTITLVWWLEVLRRIRGGESVENYREDLIMLDSYLRTDLEVERMRARGLDV